MYLLIWTVFLRWAMWPMGLLFYSHTIFDSSVYHLGTMCLIHLWPPSASISKLYYHYESVSWQDHPWSLTRAWQFWFIGVSWWDEICAFMTYCITFDLKVNIRKVWINKLILKKCIAIRWFLWMYRNKSGIFQHLYLTQWGKDSIF